MKIEDALIHITVWAAAYQDTSEDRETAEKEFEEVFKAIIELVSPEALKLFYHKIEKLEHAVKTLGVAA